MEKIIVSSGGTYTDPDALGSAIAYAELLRLQGNDAYAVLPGPLNHAITDMVRALQPQFLTTPPAGEAAYVLVDISNPDWVEKFVDLDKVIAVLDHHHGFESYWKERIGNQAKIEMIGAAATLVWEAWVASGHAHRISPSSANLLMIAIVSNSLNFKVAITSERDHAAFRELQKHGTLRAGWVEQYLQEVESALANDLENLLPHDTKTETIPQLEKPVLISQIELYDGKRFLDTYQERLLAFLRQQSTPYTFADLPSMGEECTYFVAENPRVQELLAQHFHVHFENSIARYPTIILRKMILKKLLEEQLLP